MARWVSLAGGGVVIVRGLFYEHRRDAIRRLADVGALDRGSRRLASQVVALVLPGRVIRFVMGALVASQVAPLRPGWLLLAALVILLMQTCTTLVWWACEATLFVDERALALAPTIGGARPDGLNWLVVVALALVGGLAPVLVKVRRSTAGGDGQRHLKTGGFRTAVALQLASAIITAWIVQTSGGWTAAGIAAFFLWRSSVNCTWE